MVSDKMVEALEEAFSDTMTFGSMNEVGFDEKFGAQEVVNAAWSFFDMNDKSTWPENNIFHKMLVQHDDGKHSWQSFGVFHEGQKPRWELSNIPSYVVYYLNTDDIKNT